MKTHKSHHYANLYWTQPAIVRIDGSTTEIISIRRNLHQGYVLSYFTFVKYILRKIFQEALYGRKEGIKMNGELINNVRYADDTLVLASTSEGPPNILMNEVKAHCEQYEPTLNL